MAQSAAQLANLKPWTKGNSPHSRRKPYTTITGHLKKMLRERETVQLPDGGTEEQPRNQIIARMILKLVIETYKHMAGEAEVPLDAKFVPLYRANLEYFLSHVDPVAIEASVGGITVNVTTNPQILFADRVLQLAGDGPVKPNTILEALERMPDDEGDD